MPGDSRIEPDAEALWLNVLVEHANLGFAHVALTLIESLRGFWVFIWG